MNCLGLNDALLQFESDLNRSLLPEPKRLLPMLEQIASDAKFVHIARQHSRSLAERIGTRAKQALRPIL